MNLDELQFGQSGPAPQLVSFVVPPSDTLPEKSALIGFLEKHSCFRATLLCDSVPLWFADPCSAPSHFPASLSLISRDLQRFPGLSKIFTNDELLAVHAVSLCLCLPPDSRQLLSALFLDAAHRIPRNYWRDAHGLCSAFGFCANAPSAQRLRFPKTLRRQQTRFRHRFRLMHEHELPPNARNIPGTALGPGSHARR